MPGPEWGLVAQQGAQGAQGPAGPTGPVGATGAAGSPGATVTGPTGPTGAFRWEGPYQTGDVYAVNDVAQWNGSAWVAVVAGQLPRPPDTAGATGPDWQLMAADGAIGPTGPPGSLYLGPPTGNLTADTATLQAAIDAGGPLLLNDVWNLNSPLALANKSDLVFAGTGNARAALVNNVTDLFTVSGTCARNKFTDLRLETGASGGHIFNVAGNASTSYWESDNVIFKVGALTKGAWNQPASGSTAGDFIGHEHRHFTFTQPDTATQPMWKVVNDAGGLNNNTFGPGLTNCRGVYPIWLENSVAGTWAYDNTIEKVVFEVPTNGCVKAISTNNVKIDQCSVWDLQLGAPAAADLFSLTNGAGPPTRYAKLKGIVRRGGSLAAGVADIAAIGTSCTEIDTSDTAVLTGFTINALNSAQMIVLNSGAAGAPGITWLNKPADNYEIGGNQDGSPTWHSYVPVIGTAGGTPWQLGNGTLTGRYVKIGRTIHWSVKLILGTTSVAGTGNLTLTLPVPASAVRFEDVPTGLATEQGVSSFLITGAPTSTTVVTPLTIGTAGATAGVTATAPFVWSPATRADELTLCGTYEAA